MKMIFFDTETTGLDPVKCGIHQLAGSIVVDNKVVSRFDYKINPFSGCEIEPDALAISGVKTLDFLKYNKEWQVIYMFTSLLDRYVNMNDPEKFYLVGWRAPEFDVKFLRAFFRRHTKEKVFDGYFYNNPIDVKTLASYYLMDHRNKIPHFSLDAVASFLNIAVTPSALHSAVYDAELCRRVYEILPKYDKN